MKLGCQKIRQQVSKYLSPVFPGSFLFLATFAGVVGLNDMKHG